MFSFMLTVSSCRGPAVPTSIPVTGPAESSSAEPPVYTYEIVNTYPHDPKCFTQGLVFNNGIFYESSGLNEAFGGHSNLRKVEVQTGKVLKSTNVPEPYFAEGLTLFQGQLFQLTWQDQKGFIYDRESFASQGEFHYTGEGWGLTQDGKSLIMSDGSHQLRFFDPANFKELRRISVYYQGRPMTKLNELEFIKGEIFANVWQEDIVLRIDPSDGRVLGIVDLSGILKSEDHNPDADVLNGIAYDPEQDRLFVTGKRWPKLFEIRLRKK